MTVRDSRAIVSNLALLCGLITRTEEVSKPAYRLMTPTAFLLAAVILYLMVNHACLGTTLRAGALGHEGIDVRLRSPWTVFNLQM
jgi:hypothetical protein